MATSSAKQAVFARLQPVCARLLPLRSNPGSLVSALVDLSCVLTEVDTSALQGCVDYVLFPLLMLVDAVAATRAPGGNLVFVARAPRVSCVYTIAGWPLL